MAKLIDPESFPSTKTELDLFQLPPTQVVVDRSRWKEVSLQNACTNEGPYEFRIPPDPQMLHLSKNYLYMEIKIRGAQMGDLAQAGANDDPPGDVVGPVNLFGKTFIKQVKLILNGTEVFDSGSTYAYRAFLETELNYGKEAKESHLRAALYYKDSGANIDNAENPGFVARRTLFAQNQTVELMAPIHCDLLLQDRFLVNNIDVRLRLERNSDAFCLMSFGANPAFKIEVRNMRWYVKGVDVMKSICLGLEKTLLAYTAKYPIRRAEIKTIHVAEGRRDTPENAIFNGQVPRRIVIGCVDSDAFHGTYAKSPFNFKHYDIEEVYVMAAGETYPARPLKMDFTNGRFTRAFVQLFEGTGMGLENKGNGIDMSSFRNGCCLFAFDLSPDEDDGSHWDLVAEGATSVHMKFRNAIPAGGIEVVIYAEFDGLITIDRNRNPYLDYKA